MPNLHFHHPLPPLVASLFFALSVAGATACSPPASAPPGGSDEGARVASTAAAHDGGDPQLRTGGGCLPYIEHDPVNDPPGGVIVSPPASAKVAFTLEDEFGTVCGSPGSTCTRVVALSIGSDGAWLEDSLVRGYVPAPFAGVGYGGSFDFGIALPAMAHAIEGLAGPPCPDWTPFDNSMDGSASLSVSFNGDTGVVSFDQSCIWDHWNFFDVPPHPFGPEDGFLYASSRHRVKGEGQILCPIAH